MAVKYFAKEIAHAVWSPQSLLASAFYFQINMPLWIILST